MREVAKAVDAALGPADRLCPPNRYPDVPLAWARGTLIAMKGRLSAVEGDRHQRVAGESEAQSVAWVATADGRVTCAASWEAVCGERATRAGEIGAPLCQIRGLLAHAGLPAQGAPVRDGAGGADVGPATFFAGSSFSGACRVS